MSRKIKDPEKYISKLKRRIKSLELDLEVKARKVHNFRGECLLNWKKGYFEQENCCSDALAQFRPGDFIAIVGKVTEVTSFLSANNSVHSKLKYERFQNKRIGSI